MDPHKSTHNDTADHATKADTDAEEKRTLIGLIDVPSLSLLARPMIRRYFLVKKHRAESSGVKGPCHVFVVAVVVVVVVAVGKVPKSTSTVAMEVVLIGKYCTGTTHQLLGV
jgi:hypothetical protein